MQSEFVGVTELAAELGVNRTTIHRRVFRGELVPAGYAGKQPLFTRDDVERLKRGEKQLATPKVAS